MTGFGRSERDSERARVSVEARSVNHRFIEIYLNLPPALASREIELRQRIQRRLRRGRVDVTIALETRALPARRVTVDRELLGALRQALEEVRLSQAIPGDIDMAILTRYTEAVTIESAPAGPDDELALLVDRTLDEALTELESMRHEEGRMLGGEIEERLTILDEAVANAGRAAEGLPAAAFERLRERLTQLLSEGTGIDPDRLNQELALMADRLDVTEEVVRLKAHLHAMRLSLEAGGEVGKKLDFLLQELGREANTLGSKARSSEVTTEVLVMKSEIEKLREQIRNLE